MHQKLLGEVLGLNEEQGKTLYVSSIKRQNNFKAIALLLCNYSLPTQGQEYCMKQFFIDIYNLHAVWRLTQS